MEKEIEKMEFALLRALEHLHAVDLDRRKGWKADVCLLEMRIRIKQALEAFHELFDK